MDRRTREIIDACRLFAPLDPEGRALLSEAAVRRAVPAGHVFFRQDEAAPGLYVIGRGQVRIFTIAAQGKEHVLHLPGPGETFAEAAALGGFPVPACAEALTDAEVALVPAAALHTLLEDHPRVSRQLLVGLSLWVRHVVGLMEDIVLRDAVGRIARYLLDRSEPGPRAAVHLPTPRRHLASHLNLTPETVSRCLRRLEEAGAVDAGDDGGYRVLDEALLKAAADGHLPRS